MQLRASVFRFPIQTALLLMVVLSQYAFAISQSKMERFYQEILIDPQSAENKAKTFYLKAKKSKNKQNELRYLYLYTLAESYTYTGNKLLARIKKGVKLAEGLNDATYLAYFHAVRSKIYFTQGYENKAKSFIQKAISLSTVNDNKKQEFTFKLYLAHILLNQYNANRALPLVSEAYKYFDSEDLKHEMSLALNQFAMIYDSNKQWDKAIEYYLKALELNPLGDIAYIISPIYLKIAKAYQKINKFKDSDKYLNKALKIFELLQLENKVGDVYFYKAKNQQGRGNFPEAINLYNQAISHFDKTNDNNAAFYSHLGLYFAYGELNDFPSAQVHIKRAKGIYKKFQNESFKISLLEAEKDNYERLGKFKKAYQLSQQLEALKDDFKASKNKNVLHKLQANFDGEIKQKENELLTKENKLQKAIITEQNLSIYLQITLLIFFCVVISLMFYIQLKTKRNNKALMKLALTDNLTGVANRRSIMLMATEEFERAKRYKHELTVGVVDLDFFKRVNDLYGHDEGDKVLKAFCIIAEQNIRHQDKLGRFGGEEFIVIFPHTDSSEINLLINRISKQLRAYVLPDPEHKVTFSIGVSKILADDESVDQMIKRADTALYKAKDQGRDCLVEA